MQPVDVKAGEEGLNRRLAAAFKSYEFVYRDYLRFLSAYNADQIDVGVLITHAESGLSRVKASSRATAPHLGRVRADLAWLRPTLTVPL